MKKLYRSRENKIFTGLCGGVGELLNVDATLLRILLVVLTVLSSGTLIIVYLIVSMVIPKKPDLYPPYGGGPRPFGGNPYGYHDPHQRPNQHNGQWNQGDPYQQGPHYNNPNNQYYNQGPQFNNPNPGPQAHGNYQDPGVTDKMMDDLEKKALKREIEELKAKLEKLEKGE